MVTTVYWPGSDSMMIVPLCSLIISLATLRPSPDPWLAGLGGEEGDECPLYDLQPHAVAVVPYPDLGVPGPPPGLQHYGRLLAPLLHVPLSPPLGNFLPVYRSSRPLSFMIGLALIAVILSP